MLPPLLAATQPTRPHEQVVPTALLDMSRSVMRERFSSLVTKPVYTFVFERQSPITQVRLAPPR